MPTISRFYGITVMMYFREHGIPHFHATYGDYNGVFALDTLDLIEGRLPRRAQSLVREWASQHQSELLEMWETQSFRQIRGLE
jgi:hypothetical protein